MIHVVVSHHSQRMNSEKAEDRSVGEADGEHVVQKLTLGNRDRHSTQGTSPLCFIVHTPTAFHQQRPSPRQCRHRLAQMMHVNRCHIHNLSVVLTRLDTPASNSAPSRCLDNHKTGVQISLVQLFEVSVTLVHSSYIRRC